MDPASVVEESEITFVATTRLGSAEPTTPDGSGRGDGSAAACPWSLTHEQQVQNLKENWKRALTYSGVQIKFENKFETNPWFASIVAKLRVDPCLHSCKLEIDKSLLNHVQGLRMNSLELAVLMGDLKMVQEILKRSLVPDQIICGSFMDQKKASVYHLIAISNSDTKTGILFTPLHLAVLGGDICIIDVLLKRAAQVNARNFLDQTPLEFACKLRNVPILLQLLEKDQEEGKDPLHVAVQHGDVDFMKKLPFQNVNAVDLHKKTPLHYLAIRPFSTIGVLTSIVQYLDKDKALDMKALDARDFSAFYVAVLCCNTKLVIALLDSYQGHIRLNEVCDKDRGPPIQIAFEGGLSFKDIYRALMECDPVKGYMDKLYRDRQVYVDAANAILVGAALIASVTFASWLQPPLNYTSYSGEGYSSPSTSDLNYVDVEHNIALRAFWVFNALSFYFAIGTVVCGAQSVLPRRHLFIEKTVTKLRTNLFVTSILLTCSVLFVIIAFAIAGTIVLTPLLKYKWCMIIPTIVGGMVCIVSLGFLGRSMVQIYYNPRDNHKGLSEKERDYLKERGYILHKDYLEGKGSIL